MSEADGFEKDAFSGNWRASGLDIQEKNEFAEQGRALTQEQQEEEKMDTTVSEKYDADQIQVLEGLEAVRKRPGMYIGSTGPKGLHHLVYEIVDNSIDEALAGFCTHIEVEILPNDIITVRDNGRGIPVGINEKSGIPAVTLVLTVLHAGGKFGGSGYKVSGGLHGVGSSVVNALSEWMEIEVSQDGHIHYQRFERGNIASKLTVIGDTDETGTFIKFKADPEIFLETTVYEYEVLQRRLREQAFLVQGIGIYRELCTQKGINLLIADRRISYLLYEHKVIMEKRIEYMWEEKLINEELYKKLKLLSQTARTTAFNLVHLMQKYRFRPDKREDGLIKHMISELEENDKKLMYALVYEWEIDEKESRDA